MTAAGVRQSCKRPTPDTTADSVARATFTIIFVRLGAVPMNQSPMLEGFAGAGLLLVWGGLQFFESPGTGMIHVLLGLGVVLVVRGIVTSRWGSPAPR
jgi:hypothetical protein